MHKHLPQTCLIQMMIKRNLLGKSKNICPGVKYQFYLFEDNLALKGD